MLENDHDLPVSVHREHIKKRSVTLYVKYPWSVSRRRDHISFGSLLLAFVGHPLPDICCTIGFMQLPLVLIKTIFTVKFLLTSQMSFKIEAAPKKR